MKIPFSAENKQKSDFDYPKLWLEQNEQARIVCIEPEPEMAFVHTLKSPVLINGQVQMETVKGKNGSYEQPKYDFITRALCLGSENSLIEKGKDPQNCPICALANQTDWVQGTQRRFAMNVFKYKTKPGSFEANLIDGRVQGEVVVWSFTNMVYDTLTNIATERGDLRKLDLLLGPCSNKSFQKYDIQGGGSAAWLSDEDNKNLVLSIYKQDRVEDLEVALGRKISREKAEEHLDLIMMKSRQAFGGEGPSSTGSGVSAAQETSSSLDLDALLAGDTKEDTGPVADLTTKSANPWDDVDKPSTSLPPVEDPAPEKENPKKTDPLNFDSLLEGL